MDNKQTEKALYSLIHLADFKAVLDTDDREDKLARFCLVTSTFTIEQYFSVGAFNNKIYFPALIPHRIKM